MRECDARGTVPVPMAILRRRDLATKHVISGLIVMTLTSTALASGHYTEVWNPPEARGVVAERAVNPRTHIRKRVKRQGTAHLAVSSRRRQRGLTEAAPSGPGASAAVAPTFDAIPRQMTPEGNVLRVKGSHAAVAIER